MIIHKSFRYRVYPTVEQQARLARWDSALRTVDGILLEGTGRSGKAKVKLRTPRRSPLKSSAL